MLNMSNFLSLVAAVLASSVVGGTNTADDVYRVTGENENPELVLSNQPEFPYWFPSDLLEWTPESDENLEMNKSTVPLNDRVDRADLNTVNSTQNNDTQIMALSAINASTSGNSPHGSSSHFSANTFSYWQYVDSLVYWGGSSGEGIIVPPTPDVIDLAHKHGVPVTGTIFFPEYAHGGKMEWLDEFLVQDEEGNFPIIDKLILACETYGFDGWFLNQETGRESAGEIVTVERTELIQEFIIQYKAKAPDLILQFYDSMNQQGQLSWQNALNDDNEMFMVTEDGDAVSDTMFLNFWWTNESRVEQELLKATAEKALELGLDPYDFYAGIDVEANGFHNELNTHTLKFDLFESSPNSTYTSLGIYRPDWSYNKAQSLQDFYDNESRFWVNEVADPSVDVNYAENTDFRGMSTYVVERTAINSLPFSSNFNLGNGYDFFKDGKVISNLDWNNRSLGDVMPTYRYIIENGTGNSLSAEIDMESAYYGGNSIALEGKMTQGSTSDILLYSTDLDITSEFDFYAMVKGNSTTQVSAVLVLDDGSEVVLDGSQTVGNSYAKVSFDTAALQGKTIRSISLRFSADSDNIKINLGNLTLTTETTANSAVVSNLTITDYALDEDYVYAGVALSWDSSVACDYYEVYQVHSDGTKSLLGVSNKTNFYINGLKRSTGNDTLEVVPVNTYLESGKAATVAFQWPANILPRASMKADVTLVAVGDTVTFTNTSSANATEIAWVLEGSSKPTATGETVTVTYEEEGVYDVEIIATNNTGSTTETYSKQIVVTNDAEDGLVLLSREADTEASSFVNDGEAPQFAVDGDVSTKWCAVGPAPHDITIDLGGAKTISQVKIYNAEEGGEGKDMNTSAYEIWISNDGKNFELISSETNSKVGLIDNAFAPVEARYVKVSIVKPTQGSDSAARIYEVEVLGLDK